MNIINLSQHWVSSNPLEESMHNYGCSMLVFFMVPSWWHDIYLIYNRTVTIML